MRRRGVTLLELLIVIALLAGAAALALPSVEGQLAERSFEATLERVEAQLLLARAEAMASGRPIEVRWSAEDSAIVVLPFEASRSAVGTETERADLLNDVHPGDPAWSDAMLENLIPLIEVSQVAPVPTVESIVIPREHRLIDERDDQSNAGVVPEVNDDLQFSLEAPEVESESRLLRLAVYLPDGGALLSGPLLLIDERDETRAASLEINPWTGLPRFERIKVRDEDDVSETEEANEPEFALEDGNEGTDE